MTLKIMAIGDIIGRPGRRVIREIIPALKKKLALDCVIANVENSAGGFGITHKIYSELLRSGIDLMTSGNHIYDKPETISWIDSTDRLVRPLNFPPGSPGPTSASFTTPSGQKLTILTLIGRVFMKPYDCPFREIDIWLDNRPKDEIILVDMHAEATSEKQAMGRHLAGRVSAVWGTHTHVPTADARILDNSTGFITDLGMTGPYNSVIGMKTQPVLEGFKTLQKTSFEVANDDLRLACCIFEIEESTHRCTSIQSMVSPLEDLLMQLQQKNPA